MAGEDWLAALIGGLGGGVDAWQMTRRQQREDAQRRKAEERQAAIDLRADDEHRLRLEGVRQQGRDRERATVDEILGSIGRGGRVDPTLATRARSVDLGHRISEDPDFESSVFSGAGQIPMMLPGVTSRVAPTIEERQADRQRDEVERILGALPEHLQPAARVGRATGKMPTFSADDYVPPDARVQRAIEQEVEKTKALAPWRLKEVEDKAKIDAKYRPPTQPRDERLVQIMGPNGTPIWVKESDAVGKPAAQAARAVTGAERQTLAYYNRAKEAVDTLTHKPTGAAGIPQRSLEERIAGQSTGGQYQGAYAPNILQTKEQQLYRQAQRAFTEARLRKESGAAIPASEFDNDARTYFAQPGDSPVAIEQKRRARQTVLEGLKFGAGKAYQEFYGDEGPPSGNILLGDPGDTEVKVFDFDPKTRRPVPRRP